LNLYILGNQDPILIVIGARLYLIFSLYWFSCYYCISLFIFNFEKRKWLCFYS